MVVIKLILLGNGEKINLPKSLNVSERIEFVDKLTREYPFSFTLTDNNEHNRLVSIRLDILGTYILHADKNKGNYIMSRHKVKSRAKNEIPFSSINNKLDISMNIDVNHQIM